PGRALEATDRRVAVDGHDQDVAVAPRLLEQRDVAGMQEVEAAVREHDGAAVTLPGPAFLDECREGGHRSPAAASSSRRSSSGRGAGEARRTPPENCQRWGGGDRPTPWTRLFPRNE